MEIIVFPLIFYLRSHGKVMSAKVNLPRERRGGQIEQEIKIKTILRKGILGLNTRTKKNQYFHIFMLEKSHSEPYFLVNTARILIL